MISRAYVEVLLNKTHVKVRIPRVNKAEGAVGATTTEQLATAVIATPPGVVPNLRRGDAVLVGYEDDNSASPVVIGLLFTNKQTSISDITSGSLEVKTNTILPEDTVIGKVTAKSISFLKNVSSNIQMQFNAITSKIKEIKEDLKNHSTAIDNLKNADKDIEGEIQTNRTNITKLQTTVNKGIAKAVASGHYGTSLPSTTGHSSGEIFLLIQK